MKLIKVYISDDTVVDSAVKHLERRIPERVKNSSEYEIVFPEIVSCIEDFSEKLKKLAKVGTTIRIDKTFNFSNINVLVTLEYPKTRGFFEGTFRFLKRG